MQVKQERFVTIAIVLGICIAAIAGTATVFYETRVANPTVEEYFAFMSLGHLLVISHVHLFGYATMGFVLWTLGRRRGAASHQWFGRILGMTISAGILDILSWWGSSYLTPVFRFLTFLAGAAFVGGILLASLFIILACIRGQEANQKG